MSAPKEVWVIEDPIGADEYHGSEHEARRWSFAGQRIVHLREVDPTRDALAAFALAVLREWHNNSDRGDVDGGWLQEEAVNCGVVVHIRRETPCSNLCPCLEYVGRGEMSECYAIRDDVFALMTTTPPEASRT